MWLEARSIPKTKAAQKLTLEKTSAEGNSQLIQKPQKAKLQDLCSLFSSPFVKTEFSYNLCFLLAFEV
jgi:hypothetical protein